MAFLLQVERDAGKVTKVAPLPHMFVVKDLVVDMSNFYAQYKSINPFLQKRENPWVPLSHSDHAYCKSLPLKHGITPCNVCRCICSLQVFTGMLKSPMTQSAVRIVRYFLWLLTIGEDTGLRTSALSRGRVDAIAIATAPQERCVAAGMVQGTISKQEV